MYNSTEHLDNLFLELPCSLVRRSVTFLPHLTGMHAHLMCERVFQMHGSHCPDGAKDVVKNSVVNDIENCCKILLTHFLNCTYILFYE